MRFDRDKYLMSLFCLQVNLLLRFISLRSSIFRCVSFLCRKGNRVKHKIRGKMCFDHHISKNVVMLHHLFFIHSVSLVFHQLFSSAVCYIPLVKINGTFYFFDYYSLAVSFGLIFVP